MKFPKFFLVSNPQIIRFKRVKMCDKHEPGCLIHHSDRKVETIVEYKRVLAVQAWRSEFGASEPMWKTKHDNLRL